MYLQCRVISNGWGAWNGLNKFRGLAHLSSKCRRADDRLYNLIKFDNIPNVKPSDFTETNEYRNDVLICYTNKKRMDINFI